jgi:hypothetical protein
VKRAHSLFPTLFDAYPIAARDLALDPALVSCGCLEAAGVDEELELVELAVGNNAGFGDAVDAFAICVDEVDVGSLFRRRKSATGN